MPVAARGGGELEVAKHRLGVKFAVAVGAVRSPAVEQLDELHPAGQLLQPEVADPVGVTHAGRAIHASGTRMATKSLVFLLSRGVETRI